jgi:hypothetical protein
METAKRIPPGAFPRPSDVGAVARPVCRLSGLRATPRCAALTEWFAAGTEPTATDDWERDGVVTLPEEYAGWARQQDGGTIRLAAMDRGADASAPSSHAEQAAYMASVVQPRSVRLDARDTAAAAFRIASPMDGDRYAIPAGIDARYASIALRAAGPGAQRVRWSVDGRDYEQSRWPLTTGTHVFRATSARGDRAEARVEVLP